MANRLYLRSIDLVSDAAEINFIKNQKRTVYNTIYPFKIFPDKELRTVEFEPVTIFYGGNGCGKTTLLNIIGEKLHLTRHSAFNCSAFFGTYVSMCHADVSVIPRGSQILTSDDVSDYCLNIRTLNDGVDLRREEIFADWNARKGGPDSPPNLLKSLDDYDEWLETYNARRKTQSQYTRERMNGNIDMFSNGETAMKYYVERITENALYLIDEPENSLSPARQLELREFLTTSARYYGCQFVIATHSPFILSIPGAKIYELDEYSSDVRPWAELDHVWEYYKFFKEHEEEIREANADRLDEIEEE